MRPAVNITELPAIVETEQEIAKTQIAGAWKAYQAVEKHGLAFGAVLAEWKQKFASRSGGIGTRGTGLSPILDTIGIPHSTAYFWIGRYEESIGLRKPKPAPEPKPAASQPEPPSQPPQDEPEPSEQSDFEPEESEPTSPETIDELATKLAERILSGDGADEPYSQDLSEPLGWRSRGIVRVRITRLIHNLDARRDLWYALSDKLWEHGWEGNYVFREGRHEAWMFHKVPLTPTRPKDLPDDWNPITDLVPVPPEERRHRYEPESPIEPVEPETEPSTEAPISNRERRRRAFKAEHPEFEGKSNREVDDEIQRVNFGVPTYHENPFDLTYLFVGLDIRVRPVNPEATGEMGNFNIRINNRTAEQVRAIAALLQGHPEIGTGNEGAPLFAGVDDE
jgi:hypothetical protein